MLKKWLYKLLYPHFESLWNETEMLMARTARIETKIDKLAKYFNAHFENRCDGSVYMEVRNKKREVIYRDDD